MKLNLGIIFAFAVVLGYLAYDIGSTIVKHKNLGARDYTVLEENVYLYRHTAHTCTVDIFDSGKQKWMCDDGCEYYGYPSVNIEKVLVCPDASQTQTPP